MMTTELAGQIRELIDTGAPPVSLSEIAARACVCPSRPASRAAFARPRLRLGWATAVAAGILVMGGAGAITAAQIAADGHPAIPTAGPDGALLTAAQVHQLAVASRAALAHSAREYITYGGPGPYHTFQSEYVAFSGRNYSLAGSVVNRAAGGRPGQLTWFAERVINGQAYDHQLDRGGWHWYHYTRVAGARAVRALGPRAMLRVLAPGERLRVAGHLAVGGVPLERLRASAPANVAGRGVLASVGPGESVTALNVLVDGHGVLRQVDISLRAPTLTAAARVRRTAAGKRPLAGRGPVPLTTAITVTFADIGQPQTITVPPHVINAGAPWGMGGHVTPPPVVLSAVAGS